MSAITADPLTIVPAELAAPQDREEPRVRALLDAARAGDREAFGELVALHERAVVRAARAALDRLEDAEDAAQDAFVMAWKKLPGFRGDSTFRTWLLSIVWRKALDRRRARRLWWTRTQPAERHEDECPTTRLESTGPTPEAQAEARELARRIRSEISHLSPKLKDAFLLAASGAHAYDEIAAMLRIPVGTVKWRVSEARRLIRLRLGHDHD